MFTANDNKCPNTLSNTGEYRKCTFYKHNRIFFQAFCSISFLFLPLPLVLPSFSPFFNFKWVSACEIYIDRSSRKFWFTPHLSTPIEILTAQKFCIQNYLFKINLQRKKSAFSLYESESLNLPPKITLYRWDRLNKLTHDCWFWFSSTDTSPQSLIWLSCMLVLGEQILSRRRQILRGILDSLWRNQEY